jgi:catechol 2,3-dioxygenase-like lactoylglutathione lyase family enzyme
VTQSNLLRLDNISIVVESLDDSIAFFSEIGMQLEGRAMIEGEWASRVKDQIVEIAMLTTPDGNCRIELSKFIHPEINSDHRNAPVNALGYLRVMFAVTDIDELVTRLTKKGAKLVGEIVRYENSYKLCYMRSTDGLLIGLAQEIGK